MPLGYEIPFVTSIFYYSLTAIFARTLRHFAQAKFYKFRHLYILLADFITSFQLMAFSLENGQIRAHYGEVAYVLTLVCVGLWAVYAVSDGQANPCSALIDVLTGKYRFRWALIRGLVQLCGALSSYQYAKVFWYFGFTLSHWERYSQTTCDSDLKVLAFWGFLVEFFGTLIYVAVSLTKFSSNSRLENICKSFLGAVLTILG